MRFSRINTKPRVLVLNQYAKPVNAVGGTRHIDLFSHISEWDTKIIAAIRSHNRPQKMRTEDRRFSLVWLPPHSGNGIGRISSWALYAIQATLIGIFSRRPALVYASTPQPLVPIAGWVIAKVRRVPLVVEVRDLWPDTLVSAGAVRENSAMHQVLKSLEKWMYSRAAVVIGVTAGWTEHFSRLGFGGKYHVIPNGADIEAFDVAAMDTSSLPKQLAEAPGLRCVYAGAHGPANGLDFILDAAHGAPEQTFVMIGDGPDKKRLQQRSETEELTNVVFLPSVPKSDLPRFLRSMDIGLHTLADLDVFRKGLSPNKVHDYLAAQLPVISNVPGELHHLLAESGGGIGVEPEGLSNGIDRLVNLGADGRRRMGLAGKVWLAQHRSRKRYGAELEAILNRTLESKSACADA